MQCLNNTWQDSEIGQEIIEGFAHGNPVLIELQPLASYFSDPTIHPPKKICAYLFTEAIRRCSKP